MKPSLILKVEKQMYNTTQYVNITMVQKQLL